MQAAPQPTTLLCERPLGPRWAGLSASRAYAHGEASGPTDEAFRSGEQPHSRPQAALSPHGKRTGMCDGRPRLGGGGSEDVVGTRF